MRRVIQSDADAWWGNLRVVGDTLYTMHYEWVDSPKDNQELGEVPAAVPRSS